jgi:hypothetical protein
MVTKLVTNSKCQLIKELLEFPLSTYRRVNIYTILRCKGTWSIILSFSKIWYLN